MSQMTPLTEQIETLEFPTDLPEEDGIPLESNWHRIQINLLVHLIHQLWQDATNYFAGGNMFLYFSTRQLLTHDYRGPDFFVVKDVAPKPDRRSWKTWEEDGRLPDVIVELLSPTTVSLDLTTKKALYERTFRTPEYFAYNPDTRQLYGWRLSERGYRALEPNERGWLWSEELGVWIGEWEGMYEKEQAVWLRFYTPDGRLVPTGEEAQAEARREAEARAAQFEARAAQEAEARREAEARATQEAEARREAEARAAQEAAARREAEAELTQLRAELARLRGEMGQST